MGNIVHIKSMTGWYLLFHLLFSLPKFSCVIENINIESHQVISRDSVMFVAESGNCESCLAFFFVGRGGGVDLSSSTSNGGWK